MRNLKNTIIGLLALSAISLPTVADTTPSATTDLKTQAMIITKKFGGELKPQLKSALQSGGPLQAIEVCATQAPAIAEKLSEETGWLVKRVSLKPRNNATAVTDNWEKKILMQFDERRAAGEPANQIIHYELVENQYRFMKAQAVEPICLACHGENLATEVEQALDRHYPKDTARGYSLGQIRGAFSLSKQILMSSE